MKTRLATYRKDFAKIVFDLNRGKRITLSSKDLHGRIFFVTFLPKLNLFKESIFKVMMNSKNGNAKELFENYSKDIMNYSLALLKDYDDAKDAVQEVFVRYLKSRDSFRGECSSKTWLLTITRNYCFKKLNGKAKLPKRIDENILKVYEPNLEEKISLNDALSKLSSEEYEIIYLREYVCHSYLEIAEILGISIDNVKVRLFRVRQQLRKYLQ